jgi:hypothetical protein
MRVLLFRSHQRDWLSWFISALTRGSYVHASILLGSGKPEEGNWIIEAFWPRVRRRQLANNELATIDVFSVKGITPTQEAGVVAYAYEAVRIRTPYSILNLFRFLAFLRVFLGEGYGERIGDPTICSQFAQRAVRDADGVLTPGGVANGIELVRAHSEDVDPVRLGESELLLLGPALQPI